MKIKRIKIGLRPPGTIFDEATIVLQHIESGKKVATQPEWLYFSDIRAMGKVLTPKRLELLKTIHDHHPESVRALAVLTGRDVRNVAEDLRLLASLGLVEMKENSGPNRRKTPIVNYETLSVEVHL